MTKLIYIHSRDRINRPQPTVKEQIEHLPSFIKSLSIWAPNTVLGKTISITTACLQGSKELMHLASPRVQVRDWSVLLKILTRLIEWAEAISFHFRPWPSRPSTNKRGSAPNQASLRLIKQKSCQLLSAILASTEIQQR